MGKVKAICVSEKRGTKKVNIGRCELVENHGLKGDAHAGNWHRQVSLLSYDRVEEFRARGASVDDGAFGENLLVEGIDFKTLPVGTRLRCNDVLFEITQIGKECHAHCEIFRQVGDCIMPREGVFARVLKGGMISVGDEMRVVKAYRAGIITASDKGARGEREDISGETLKEMLRHNGYEIASYCVLPDDMDSLASEMTRLADGDLCDVVFTTGGTGFSPRDVTPEATLSVAHRQAPGISEAMRAASMKITDRAMLSRGVSVIRNTTLIINLPGSPKAVKESLDVILGAVLHGLAILRGDDSECAR